MTTLKKKIKIIDSLPPENKEKKSIISILIYITITLVILTIGYLIYTQLIPYIFATDINKITGKKTTITECNTKDYIIINKDKSYTMGLTNNDCEQQHFEGDIIIKNNEIIFNKSIKGKIDNNNNIIINNNLFESENNEWRNKKYIKQFRFWI